MRGTQNVGKPRVQWMCQQQVFGCFRAVQALSRVDENTNFRFLIDAKYGTKGVTQRGELEHGSNGDLWSIFFRLIDGRSGKTDVIKVKSHLVEVGPSVIQQNKIVFHHMLANSLADVVVEEAAKRLLSDMNSEQKAKMTECMGVSAAKMLALVQAHIWVKRESVNHIHDQTLVKKRDLIMQCLNAPKGGRTPTPSGADRDDNKNAYRLTSGDKTGNGQIFGNRHQKARQFRKADKERQARDRDNEGSRSAENDRVTQRCL